MASMMCWIFTVALKNVGRMPTSAYGYILGRSDDPERTLQSDDEEWKWSSLFNALAFEMRPGSGWHI
ncbi:hypothetical protein DVJ77_02955 [Dyella tabacisoli]|uniref:Uncharacterized protein n=1 Tax=Dyella tabacisoli TaxID=2282381 RepID=A0A369UVC1_9GAMM|nr:hypothetical protein DVJ77_02955 [Dyella tabacisoli]